MTPEYSFRLRCMRWPNQGTGCPARGNFDGAGDGRVLVDVLPTGVGGFDLQDFV